MRLLALPYCRRTRIKSTYIIFLVQLCTVWTTRVKLLILFHESACYLQHPNTSFRRTNDGLCSSCFLPKRAWEANENFRGEGEKKLIMGKGREKNNSDNFESGHWTKQWAKRKRHSWLVRPLLLSCYVISRRSFSPKTPGSPQPASPPGTPSAGAAAANVVPPRQQQPQAAKKKQRPKKKKGGWWRVQPLDI